MRWALFLVATACIEDSSRPFPANDPPDARPGPTADASIVAGPGSVLSLTVDDLTFAVVGDTRPPMADDTAGYPAAVITRIWQGVAAAGPAFAVATGDYVFVDDDGRETSPQLDIYLRARAAYGGPFFPALGNHECATATVSNCGPGSTSGLPPTYVTYLDRMVEPLGVDTPYYTVRVTPRGGGWTAKVVVVAANAWSAEQASWLEQAMAEATTYTFVVRHTPNRETRAPGTDPSRQIVERHPYTMLLVGHSHSYERLEPRELLVGNGGAPATSSAPYGYVIARRRPDGAVEMSAYRWDNYTRFDSFAIWSDGSSAD